jgi:hypothetical protein
MLAAEEKKSFIPSNGLALMILTENISSRSFRSYYVDMHIAYLLAVHGTKCLEPRVLHPN